MTCAGAVLAACKPAPQPTATPAVAPATEAPKATEAVEGIVVWMSDDWSGQADKFVAYKQMVQDCATKVGIPVDYRIVDYTTIGQQVPIIMAADKFTCDIVPMGFGGVFNWARQGKLLPLDDLLPEAFVKQAVPALLENGSYQGKLYGLDVWPSWEIGFYNKDLYEKAGLDPEKGPTTLAEMEEHIKKLQGVCQYAYLDTWTDWHWGRIFQQLVYAKDGHEYEGATRDDPDNITWTYTSAECKEAVEWMRHMYQEKLLSRDSVNLSQQDIADKFALGDVGITFNWDGFAAILEKPDVSKVIGRVGAFGFPGDEPGKAVGLYGDEQMAMPKTAKNPQGAAKWIQCIESAEVQKARALSQYFNPLFSALYQDPEVQKKLFYWEVVEEIAPRTIPSNYHPDANEVNDYFLGKLQEVVLGQADAVAMLADVQAFAEEKTKG